MGIMDGLSGWLKQIIAVVLLASLVDLLLPNRTMQRYVRLVAGLFILLTVITPLLGWLKGDFGDRLAAGLSQVEEAPGGAPDQLAMIEQEGAKLRDRQAKQTSELVTARLAEQIRADVAQSEGRPVRSVDIKTDRNADGAWLVKEVAIVLDGTSPQADGHLSGEADSSGGAIADSASSPEKSASRPIADIAPVAPVDPVEVDIAGSERPDSFRPKNGAEPALAEPDIQVRTRIAAFVAARYGLPTDTVVVTETNAPTKY
ncbi:stage III sporulation protein AF [Cohnella faecalis]|uniref:Stage III sporulation protein AF n=1 Tax=Cohnella faecalis TaxID=2315694 RepID=A0A398CDF9_9BACL|nr:stage III sporulation protein AF [Cohnella faecalis]RIE00733.1 hypothetical protein D3H35_26420 [Cohnella faecalis]